MKQYLREQNCFETAQILTYKFKNTKSMFPGNTNDLFIAWLITNYNNTVFNQGNNSVNKNLKLFIFLQYLKKYAINERETNLIVSSEKSN
ncbi:hypothetical protein T12_6481 [Trichinella patagoniensis]|uniref:Uncharacterized protein n=1 Tax=Trichinella patagoniensis TaxID=990121 RepID=A0A0V0Z5A5_9BILA|nr:hypothetical protein T12_6481 [Trichinella patagoniensis]